MPTSIVLAASIALVASAGHARAQSDPAARLSITDAEVEACRPSHQTRWRERSLREGKWRVRARVDRQVPDHTAVELLVAVRDARLLDPHSVLAPSVDGSASWLVNARRDAEVGTINACVVPEGHAPRFLVGLVVPRESRRLELILEIDGGVAIRGYAWFLVN